MRTIQICSGGECGGDCYRCRVRRLLQQRDDLFTHLRKLLDAGTITAAYGSWSDQWSGEDRALWGAETADDYFNALANEEARP